MIALNREITMNKVEVIAALQRHRAKHIDSYNKAKIAFKKKAEIELKKASRQIARGGLTLAIHLVSPVDRRDYYDNAIKMFRDEIKATVILTQHEYNEYILDGSNVAKESTMSNSYYVHTLGRSKKL